MDATLVGFIGELKTMVRIQGGSSKCSLKYLSNFPIKSKDTYYQVDAIVVCTKGIFCVEVKTWSGIVTCTDHYYWSVQYPGRTIPVRSPIEQNRIHCQKVHSLVGHPAENIILFTGGTIIKDKPDNVKEVSAFVPFLESRKDILSEEEVQTIYDKLVAYKRSIEPEMLVDFIFKQKAR